MATVSGILSNRSDCYASEETRQRVKAMCLELGYRPSIMARALHGKPTATVGLLVPYIHSAEIVAREMASFERGANAQGSMVILTSSQNDPAQEDRMLIELVDRYVDGIAIYPTEQGSHQELRRLVMRGFPIVTFDAAERLPFKTDDVSACQFEGGCMQARHLLDIGRRRACVITSSGNIYVNTRKLAGLEQTLAKAGCPPVKRMEIPIVDDRGGYRNETPDTLRHLLGECDALVAPGDLLALTALHMALNLGIRVPADLAIIGYNDMSFVNLTNPPLTTIHDPAEEMGSQAFELLQQRINGTAGNKPRRIEIMPTLHIRGSTVAV